jgi:hypothetical protein
MPKTKEKQANQQDDILIQKQGIRNVDFDLVIHTENGTITVPAVMMVPGVHNGSRGAVLHTAEGLEQYANEWNGIPVTIGHPQNAEGQYISANTEGVIRVGTITNARFENGKLKADLVLNENKLIAASPQAYQYIKANRALDVSIGSYSDERNEEGEWKGETYIAVAINYRADHLAILPGEVGACSWNDGCGIRVNSNSNNQTNEVGMIEKIRKVFGETTIINPIQINVEQGLQETLMKVSRYVDSLDSERMVNWIEEVYQDYFVYRSRVRESNETEKYFKQSYTMNEAGELVLDGEPERVVKSVEYAAYSKPKVKVKISNNKSNDSEESEKKGETKMKQKVDALIQCNRTQFTDCDREFLLTLNEEQLDKMMPVEVESKVSEDDVKTFIQTNAAETEKALALLPESLRKQMEQGMAMYAEKRTNLIKGIQANAEAGWSEDELKAMPTETLEKIAKMNPEKEKTEQGNYVAAPGGNAPVVNKGTELSENDAFMIPGYQKEKSN